MHAQARLPFFSDLTSTFLYIHPSVRPSLMVLIVMIDLILVLLLLRCKACVVLGKVGRRVGLKVRWKDEEGWRTEGLEWGLT